MKCPHCNIPLLMTERKNVEIDYCSQCRGIWLDKGELDKIIEMTINERQAGTPRQPTYAGQAPQGYVRGGYADHYKGHHKSHYPHKPYYAKHRKKKSLMSELFDIFD